MMPSSYWEAALTMVRWEEFEDNPAGFEKLASVLILRVFPGTERIDGKGGDGGRDAQRRGPNGITFFEFKKFTKVNSSQRRQIKKSLDKAAQSKPEKWVLVLPTDKNPALDEWFTKQLQPQYDFQLEWLGRTWLDAHIAQHPDLRRYILDTAQNEVYNAVVESKTELEYLKTAPQYFARQRALSRRADELSHIWNLQPSADGQKIKLKPKPGGQPADYALTVGIAIPEDDNEGLLVWDRAQHALQFGGNVELPGKYVESVHNEHLQALGFDLSSTELRLDAAIDNTGLPAAANIDVIDRNGNSLTPMLFVQLTRREVGSHGVTLTGHDTSHLLRIRLIIGQLPNEQPRITVNFDFEFLKEAGTLTASDPGAFHRILAVIAKIANPHKMRIQIGGQTVTLPCTNELDSSLAHARDLVGDIVAIRETFSVPLQVPENFDKEEISQIRFAAKLARFEVGKLRRDSKPIAHVKTDRLDDFISNFPPEGTAIEVHGEHLQFDVAGQAIKIAPVWVRYTRVTIDTSQAVDLRSTQREVPVTFEPTPDSEVLVSRRSFRNSPPR